MTSCIHVAHDEQRKPPKHKQKNMAEKERKAKWNAPLHWLHSSLRSGTTISIVRHCFVCEQSLPLHTSLALGELRKPGGLCW